MTKLIIFGKKFIMLKKETIYAIRSLVYICLQNYKNNQPGISEIANEISAPYYFVGKILQRLVRLGFLKSKKGKNGGFYCENNKPVTLDELIRAIEGNVLYNKCFFGIKECDAKNPCPLHEKYVLIAKEIEKFSKEQTIQAIARKFYENSNYSF